MISLAGSSNSSGVASVVQSPAGNNADGREESPAVTAPQRSSPPVFVTPSATRGPSPLAELNAITVIKHHKSLDKIHTTSFFGGLSNALHVFSQADEMRYTLLLDENGELKDVATGKIVTSQPHFPR